MQYTDQIKYVPGGGATVTTNQEALVAGGVTSIREEFIHTASKGFIVLEVKDSGVGIPRNSI